MVKDATFFTDESGIVWAYTGPPIDPNFVPDRRYVTPVCIPHADYANLVGAAMLLYRVTEAAGTALSTFIELLEEHGADEAVFAFQEIVTSLHVARRVANEGGAKLFPSV